MMDDGQKKLFASCSKHVLGMLTSQKPNRKLPCFGSHVLQNSPIKITDPQLANFCRYSLDNWLDDEHCNVLFEVDVKTNVLKILLPILYVESSPGNGWLNASRQIGYESKIVSIDPRELEIPPGCEDMEIKHF